MDNVKLRFDSSTGKVGKTYPESMDVAEPYLTITVEQSNEISSQADKVFFVVAGELTSKNKADIEAEESIQKQKEIKRAELQNQIDELEKSQARPLRELRLDTTNQYSQAKLVGIDNQIVNLRTQIKEIN